MRKKIDHWAGTGFRDHSSPDGTIAVREEAAGEVARMASAEYWHLNREFEGRSLFYGTGVSAIIDPRNRFLALRDAGVILLFDYTRGSCCHASSPWKYDLEHPSLDFHDSFPRLEFREDCLSIRSSDSQNLGCELRYDSLSRFFTPSLGDSSGGFLTHWRQGGKRECDPSRRLSVERSDLLSG